MSKKKYDEYGTPVNKDSSFRWFMEKVFVPIIVALIGASAITIIFQPQIIFGDNNSQNSGGTAVNATLIPIQVDVTSIADMVTLTSTTTHTATATHTPILTHTATYTPTVDPKLCPPAGSPDAIFSQPLSELGTLVNAGTGVFERAVIPNGSSATSYQLYSEVDADHPCLQSVSYEIDLAATRSCYTSNYNTNRIWFGSVVTGASIEVKPALGNSYINIGTQTRQPTAIGYLVEYELKAGDELCIVPPEGQTMYDLSCVPNGPSACGHHMRIGRDLLEYVVIWCNIGYDDGSRNWC